MKKTILEIYALSVCFATLVCFVVALGIASYGTIGIVNPHFTVSSWVYAQHQSNDAFWSVAGSRGVRDNIDDTARARPNESELTKLREASYEREIASERRGNFQSVTKASIVMLIDVVVFILHWVLARRERGKAA